MSTRSSTPAAERGAPALAATAGDPQAPPLEAVDVVRRFREKLALRGVSLRVERGEIHALLGPNGAGKTTLLRILAGLATPDEGDVRSFGRSGHRPMTRDARAVVGLVPSGDRSFYLRLSGVENLVFFARLYGLPKKEAFDRAREMLRWVRLEDAGERKVGEYSHGMQKRLSVARGLMMDPPILLVDEATHDLDPEAATQVRELVMDARDRGTAVIWATQRIDEIRGFADQVTILHQGLVRFEGSVPQLMATTAPLRYVVHLRSTDGHRVEDASPSLEGLASLVPSGDEGTHGLLILHEPGTLGRALARLEASGFQVLTCREERSEIESAFLALTREQGP